MLQRRLIIFVKRADILTKEDCPFSQKKVDFFAKRVDGFFKKRVIVL